MSSAGTSSASAEKYARGIGRGPRLLKGVAGSGKTLVLLQRAIYKAKYDPFLLIDPELPRCEGLIA
jgi:hypothetical protein